MSETNHNNGKSYWVNECNHAGSSWFELTLEYIESDGYRTSAGTKVFNTKKDAVSCGENWINSKGPVGVNS